MITNHLRARINAGEPALGGWVNSTDPLIAEIFATFECDFLFIDTEHEPIGRRDLMGLIMACKGTPCTPLVRVPGNAPEYMKWVLDLGAGGIVVPQIRDMEDVSRAVNSARYHPKGDRGIGAMRAADFGANTRYYEEANDQVVLMLQAEDIKLVENLDAVLAADGYDAIFIGPMDLSQTMGHLGHPEHPDVQAAIDTIVTRTAAAGKAVAMSVGSVEDMVRRRKQGASIFILGSDYRFIRDGIKEKIAGARSVLK